jgi:hypothetical protein
MSVARGMVWKCFGMLARDGRIRPCHTLVFEPFERRSRAHRTEAS